eukprot:6166140-Pyramimonas_sp.AAC.1
MDTIGTVIEPLVRPTTGEFDSLPNGSQVVQKKRFSISMLLRQSAHSAALQPPSLRTPPAALQPPSLHTSTAAPQPPSLRTPPAALQPP